MRGGVRVTRPLLPGSPGVPLPMLVRVLNQAFVQTVTAPPGEEVRIRSVVLVDADDLADPGFSVAGGADLWLLAGVPDAAACSWLCPPSGAPPANHPPAL